MRAPRVLVIYNEPVLAADHPDAASEHDIVATSAAVERMLADAGFRADRVGFSRDPSAFLKKARLWKPDAVFNLFEGLADRTGTEISAVGLLEWLELPFTGSPSAGIALGRDKIRTKFLLRGAGLPTAPFAVVDSGPAPKWRHAWPAIVKPACQDSSVGIDQGSVVTSQSQLADRVAVVFERYGGPVLVEEFVFGREFHVNLIEEPDADGRTRLTMVPLAEIKFDYEPGHNFWPIYSYDAKWNTETVEYLSTPLETSVQLPAKQMESVGKLGRDAFRLVGLRDYGRIDLRVAEDGRPFVLEVNPNPYLNSIALVRGLEEMGRAHPDFIAGLVENALRRAGRPVGRRKPRAAVVGTAS